MEPTPERGGADRALMLVALGVVFGDIGTSPLYAVRECFHGEHGIAPTPDHVLGVLSLIVWSLVIVISIKYLLVVMRADNGGEGGILALTALARRPDKERARGAAAVVVLVGIFGAALLYGDGMITPAISVLSAVEGLEIVTPVFRPYVLPLASAILLGLFLIQRRGTARVGKLFGPVTLLWFLVLGASGVLWIAREPAVLSALSPHHAVEFFAVERGRGFLVLGTVFLVVTGGEALYADMGHFGPAPIRAAWFAVALPGLLLNYLGQGALLLRDPSRAENPFYHLFASWALIPMVVLATLATIIASQAVITGSFSLTWQAVQLGYLPRVRIKHTSEDAAGQIYIPVVNWVLLVAVLALVAGFRSSSALAAAYGVAVTTTMVITTLLLAVVMRRRWGWGLAATAAVTGAFLIADLAFFGASMTKLSHGGWFPLTIGLVGLVVMTTWHAGRRILGERLRETGVEVDAFRDELAEHDPHRVTGTAVFLTGSVSGVPPAMVWLQRHASVLHERAVMLTIRTLDRPRVPNEERLDVTRVEPWLYRVEASYGYMQRPNVPRVLVACRREPGLEDLDPATVTYVVGRETLLATDRPGMSLWRERLFALMSRNALRATAYFAIPADQVLEVGAQIEL